MVAKPKNRNMEISIGKLRLKNPIIAASGTFGYAEEMSGLFDVGKLGAIVTKTITLKERKGNPAPRIIETPSGMLNSIGLENKGLNDFIFHKIPVLETLNTDIIVSISGEDVKEFCKLAEGLSKLNSVSAIELNLSCPNVKHKTQSRTAKLMAQDRAVTGGIVRAVRKLTRLPVITKLSPNVTDIKEIAKTAEGEGSDAIAAVNTVFGLSVDIKTKRPALGNITGGLSGPAIKPIALYFIREIFSCVKIPVIGMGGIMSADDAVEFMMCGARAVQVGTANFVDPYISLEILEGIKGYMEENKINDIMSVVGSLKGTK